MAKAKIASKNNPEGRGLAKEYFHNGKKIKPVKLIANRQSFFAAEYDESGDIVMDSTGRILPWNSAKSLG
jgi:antitoxin component YwqK of YwqJK toxin-antitoxin module